MINHKSNRQWRYYQNYHCSQDIFHFHSLAEETEPGDSKADRDALHTEADVEIPFEVFSVIHEEVEAEAGHAPGEAGGEQVTAIGLSREKELCLIDLRFV